MWIKITTILLLTSTVVTSLSPERRDLKPPGSITGSQTTRREIVARMTRTHSRARRAATSAGAVPLTVTAGGEDFNQFYSGSGFTEDDDNPSNDGGTTNPPITTTFAGTVSAPRAVQDCADYGADQSDGYYAFQLYYLNDQDIWTCRVYYKESITDASDDSSAAYFTVPNSQASPVYGYQA